MGWLAGWPTAAGTGEAVWGSGKGQVCGMQWIPELGVVNTDTMQPIQGVDSISRDRWGLMCSVCKQRCGAKIQCNKCCTAFHPLCGRLKGLKMDMLENALGPHLPLVTILLCHKHCTPNASASGVHYLCAPSQLAVYLVLHV